MAQNSTNPIIPPILPRDLTPAQRARLKLYSHFAAIFVFNAILVAISYLGGNIDYKVLLISVVAQAALALLDAMKKYYGAQGDIPIATLVSLASSAVQQVTPPADLKPDVQAMNAAATQVFNSPPAQPVSNPQVNTQWDPPPTPTQVIPQASQAQFITPPVVTWNIPPVRPVDMSSSLPNIAAINTQQGNIPQK